MKSIHRYVQIGLMVALAGSAASIQAQPRKDEGSQGIIINAQPLPPEKPKAEEPTVQKRHKKRKQPEHFTAVAPKEKPAKPAKPAKVKKAKN